MVLKRMSKILPGFLIFALWLAGCNKPAAPAAALPAGDAVQQKLQALAGSGATDCGRVKSQQDASQLQSASNCAMDAAKSKHPFFVAYEMPGLTVAMAGNSEGQLFSVQSSAPDNASQGAAAQLSSEPCPSALRVAQSGRVTCMVPGSMGAMGSMGSNPHGGISMPPMGSNPHGGMGMPPAGTLNPHDDGTMQSGHAKTTP